MVEDQLRAVSRDSGTFGDLVYVGTVAPLKAQTKPGYEYERRVKEGHSTSFTKQGTEPVLIEEATHDADYGLSSYVQWQLQTREVGRVTVENGVVRLSQASGGGSASPKSRCASPSSSARRCSASSRGIASSC